MKKLICLSLISLVCGFLSVHASIQADDTKPFVGKWEYWEGNSQIQLEIDLYNTPTDGSYGAYNVFEGGYGLTYSIVDVYHIDNTEASVAVESSMGNKKRSSSTIPPRRNCPSCHPVQSR